jgi:hypothetical protein
VTTPIVLPWPLQSSLEAATRVLFEPEDRPSLDFSDPTRLDTRTDPRVFMPAWCRIQQERRVALEHPRNASADGGQ